MTLKYNINIKKVNMLSRNRISISNKLAIRPLCDIKLCWVGLEIGALQTGVQF
jgi:hypothetical protein